MHCVFRLPTDMTSRRCGWAAIAMPVAAATTAPDPDLQARHSSGVYRRRLMAISGRRRRRLVVVSRIPQWSGRLIQAFNSTPFLIVFFNWPTSSDMRRAIFRAKARRKSSVDMLTWL